MIPPELTPLYDGAPGTIDTIEVLVYAWIDDGPNIDVTARTDNGYVLTGLGDTVEEAVAVARVKGWVLGGEAGDDGNSDADPFDSVP
jgi:hypothetical protein